MLKRFYPVTSLPLDKAFQVLISDTNLIKKDKQIMDILFKESNDYPKQK